MLLKMFMAALAVRWIYAIGLYVTLGDNSLQGVDSIGYLNNAAAFAKSIVSGELHGLSWIGPPDFMMPLFRWMLALCVMAFGSFAALAYVLLQGALDACTCVLIYRMAEEISPDFAMAYRNRGLAHYECNKLNEAITDYSKAIELVPDYTNAFYDRALSHYKLAQYKEAIADFNNVLKLVPNDMASLNGLANVYRALKDFDKALEHNTKSLTVDPANPGLFGTRAEILADRCDDEGFYENIEKAVSLGLDMKQELADEPAIISKYLSQSRFLELLKKHNIELAVETAAVK